MERLLVHAAELYALDAPVVLAGDYNVVPTDADIYPTKSYKDNALVQSEPRALFRRLLGQGWIDAIRTLHPNTRMYTFWDYMRNRCFAMRRGCAESRFGNQRSRHGRNLSKGRGGQRRQIGVRCW
jgi:exonuclease III